MSKMPFANSRPSSADDPAPAARAWPKYALILALIAIIAIVALTFLGGQVSKILSTVGKSI